MARSYFSDEIAKIAVVLVRWAAPGQPPGFTQGVRALAEVLGAASRDLTEIDDALAEEIERIVEKVTNG